MKDRSDDLSHQERTVLPRSYISLLTSASDSMMEWRRAASDQQRFKRTLHQMHRRNRNRRSQHFIYDHVTKDRPDNERGHPGLPIHGLLSINRKRSLLNYPAHRTYIPQTLWHQSWMINHVICWGYHHNLLMSHLLQSRRRRSCNSTSASCLDNRTWQGCRPWCWGLCTRGGWT